MQQRASVYRVVMRHMPQLVRQRAAQAALSKRRKKRISDDQDVAPKAGN